MPTFLHMVSDLTVDLPAILDDMGERVIIAYSSGDVLQEVIRRRADVIILPDKHEPVEGVDLLPVVRRMTNQPIVLIGGADPNQQAQALLQGADVYLKLPLRPTVVRSRLMSLIRPRRNRPLGASKQEVPQAESTALRSVELGLSPTENRLLSALMNAGGQFVAPDNLATEVWGEPDKLDSLRFYVGRLRMKLTDRSTLRILNQKGLGYRIEYAVPTTVRV